MDNTLLSSELQLKRYLEFLHNELAYEEVASTEISNRREARYAKDHIAELKGEIENIKAALATLETANG